MERVLKHLGLKSFILLLSILALGQSAFATTVVIPSDDDMVVGARAIVRAKVVSIESAFDDKHRIFTYVTLKVQEVFKGELTERRIVLKEMGGQVGTEGSRVFGNPQFTRGEKVLLYLDTWPDGSLRTHQMFLGKFSIVQDEKTDHQFVVRGDPDENVTVLPNTQSSAQSTNRMELGAYVELLRRNLSVNAERSQNFQETYYRNAPLLSRPAEYAGIAGKGEIHLEWTYISTAHPRWFEPDSGEPVVFMVNPDGAPNPQISDDIVAAMNAWSTIPGCSLRLQNGGTTEACGPSIGLNTIIFNNCDGRWSPSACAGVLAIGGLGWNGNSTVVNGVTFLQAQGGFISFNPYAACNFGNHCNVQEVTTHELGHTIGLGHSADSSATMYAIAHFDGRCASVRQDDKDGVIFIYPGAGGGPGPLSIVTSSLPAGTVGTTYSQSLAASGGTLPYGWSLVQGQGSLPPGLSLSSGGSITGTPTTTGTYNFTAKVTDAASATAQKALSIVVASAGGALDSQFVSQTVPTTLQPGQSFDVNLKFLNTGTQTWSGAAFYLISQNPSFNQTWGGYYLPLSSFVVAPGQQLDVTFTAYAPSSPGTYNFQWQLYQNGGVGFFGQVSTNVAIQVGSVPTDNAAFATQTVPATMTAGRTYSVSVTMTNMGTTTWAAGSYYLGSQNPQANTTWGLNRVNVASPVAPNSQATFTFNVTAPSTPGAYNFQWQMVNGSGYFGSLSTNVVVTASRGKTPFDFDGDGKTDIGVYRSSTGQFIIQNSSNGQATVVGWGSPALGDLAVPGDYDGDGKTDIAVYRSSSGYWLIVNSSTGQSRVQWWGYQSLGDIPVPADYDGDGKTDIAVFRGSTGQWIILNSSDGQARVQWWGYQTLGDVPVPGDYDGDGKTDIAIFRKSTGQWVILNSSNGQATVQWWGYQSLGDVPVAGDYDGDGKTDIAVFRNSTGQWIILNSSNGQARVQWWGYQSLGDVPVQGDYDGDGKADLAVFRNSTGQWIVLSSSSGQGTAQWWGYQSLGDVPLPSVYNR